MGRYRVKRCVCHGDCIAFYHNYKWFPWGTHILCCQCGRIGPYRLTKYEAAIAWDTAINLGWDLPKIEEIDDVKKRI